MTTSPPRLSILFPPHHRRPSGVLESLSFDRLFVDQATERRRRLTEYQLPLPEDESSPTTKVLDVSLTISSDPAAYEPVRRMKEKGRRRRSRRSTVSTSNDQEPALELLSVKSMRARNNYTGPGFVSLPPGLARSPTARLVPYDEPSRVDEEPGGDEEVPPSPSWHSTTDFLQERRERRGSYTTQTPLYERLLGEEPSMSGELRRPHVHSMSRVEVMRSISGETRAGSADEGPTPGKRKLARRALSIIGLDSRKRSKPPDAPPRSTQTWIGPIRTENLSELVSVRSEDMMGGATSCGYRVETTAKEYAARDVVNFLSARGSSNTRDLDRFEKAYAENDIPVMVELISSVEKFDRLDSALHPWAAAPHHVGALSMFNLGALASVEGDTSIKETIRSTGAIPKLVKQLSSRHEDCSDAALLALSFLSVDYPRGCLEMFDADIFPNLIPLLRKAKNGVRAAAAQTARNIYVLEVRCRRAFRDQGGCQPLVDLLALPPGPFDPSELDVQLESVEHIADFIINNGEEIPDCVTAIKLSNVVRRLEPLLKVEGNVELREAAQQLYLRVAE